MAQYKYIGSADPLVDLLGTVTLKVRKSDNTLLVIENIVRNTTVFDVTDSRVIQCLDLDPKYEEVV